MTMQQTGQDSDITHNGRATEARNLVLAGLAACLLAALAGLAFAGWSTHGAEIFMTYVQNGLSWCL